MGPRNWYKGMNNASLCSLACRYDNPIPPRYLAPMDSLKIPALYSLSNLVRYRRFVEHCYLIQVNWKHIKYCTYCWFAVIVSRLWMLVKSVVYCMIKWTVSLDGHFSDLNINSTFCLCADGVQGLSKAFHYTIHLLTFYLLKLLIKIFLKILTESLLRITFSVISRCFLVPTSQWLKGNAQGASSNF